MCSLWGTNWVLGFRWILLMIGLIESHMSLFKINCLCILCEFIVFSDWFDFWFKNCRGRVVLWVWKSFYICNNRCMSITIWRLELIGIIYTNSVPTSHPTFIISITENNQWKFWFFFCENPMKSINVSCGQNVEYFSAECGDSRNKYLVLNG